MRGFGGSRGAPVLPVAWGRTTRPGAATPVRRGAPLTALCHVTPISEESVGLFFPPGPARHAAAGGENGLGGL